MLKEPRKSVGLFDRVSLFKFHHEVNALLKNLRAELPYILEFEEVCIITKSIDSSSGSYISISPNLSKEAIRNSKKADLFYLHPYSGFTLECMATGKIRHVKGPRNHEMFMEGVDCLCPLVFLTDVVYVPLKTNSGELVGVLQAVNKKYGQISEDDIKLFSMLSPVLANALQLVTTGIILSLTMDQMAVSAGNLTACVEQTYKLK